RAAAMPDRDGERERLPLPDAGGGATANLGSDVVERAALVVGAPPSPRAEGPQELLEVRHDDPSAARPAKPRQYLLAQETDRLERLLVRRVPADHRDQHELIEPDRLEPGDGTRDIVR